MFLSDIQERQERSNVKRLNSNPINPKTRNISNYVSPRDTMDSGGNKAEASCNLLPIYSVKEFTRKRDDTETQYDLRKNSQREISELSLKNQKFEKPQVEIKMHQEIMVKEF